MLNFIPPQYVRTTRDLALTFGFAGLLATARAEDIQVAVHLDRPAAPLSSWWQPSVFASWALKGVPDLIQEARAPLGLVRLSVERELGESRDLDDLVKRLRQSPVNEPLRQATAAGATVVLTLAKTPWWVSDYLEVNPRGKPIDTPDGDWRTFQTRPPGRDRREAWRQAVRAVVHHFNVELKQDRVWFEFWNEPDSANFWSGTGTQFLEMYADFARAAREADPRAKVGGPTPMVTFGKFQRSGERIMPAFLAYCRDHRLPLDFVSYHDLGNSTPRGVRSRGLPVIAALRDHGFGDLPLVIDEHVGHDEDILPSPSWPSPPSPNGRHAEAEMGAGYALTFLYYADRLQHPGFQSESLDTHERTEEFFAGTFSSRRTNLDLHGIRKPGYWAYLLPGWMAPNQVPVEISPSADPDLALPHFFALASQDKKRVTILLWNYVCQPAADALEAFYAEALDGAENPRFFEKIGGRANLAKLLAGRGEPPPALKEPRFANAVAKARRHYQRQRELVTEHHRVTLSFTGAPRGASGPWKLTRYLIDATHSNSYYHYRKSGLQAAIAHQGLEAVDSRMIRQPAEIGPIEISPYSVTLLVLERP